MLDRASVLVIDPDAGKVVGRAPHKGGSYAGIVFTPDGKRLLASSIGGTIGVFEVEPSGDLEPRTPIKLAAGDTSPEAFVPVGLAVSPDGKTLWAVLNLRNTLAEIDLASGTLKREIAVGNAPYGVALVGDTAYVSNWAGRKPDAGSTAGPSRPRSGGARRSRRFIASDGSVSVVDLKAGKEQKQIVVGLHPSAIIATPDGAHVIVANANSDTVSVIDTRARRSGRNDFHPAGGEPALWQRPQRPGDQSRRQDALRRQRHQQRRGGGQPVARQKQAGRLFPHRLVSTALLLDAKRGMLYVANVKGVGSRNVDWKGERRVKGKEVFGYNSHDHLGTISLVELPSRATWACTPRRCWPTTGSTESIKLWRRRAPTRRRAVPQRHGEPSLIKHVIYIIKENRTYDQVFGDVKRGRRRPRAVHLRRGSDAQPSQAGRRVRAVRQLLLQRRAQRRRPPVGQRSLCHRLPGKGLWRLAAQLSLRRRRPAGLRLERLPLGQRPGAPKDAPHLRRIRPGHDPLDRCRPRGAARLQRLLPRFPGSRGSRRNSRRGHDQVARAVRLPHHDRLSQHRQRRLSGRSIQARAQAVRGRRQAAQPDDHAAAERSHHGHAARHAHARGLRGRQRPGAGAGRRGDEPQQVLARDGDLRRGGRSAGRLRPRRRPPHRGHGDQPLHAAASRRQHQLQPDQHGPDDRADPGPAADEPARRVGHADGCAAFSDSPIWRPTRR